MKFKIGDYVRVKKSPVYQYGSTVDYGVVVRKPRSLAVWYDYTKDGEIWVKIGSFILLKEKLDLIKITKDEMMVEEL